MEIENSFNCPTKTDLRHLRRKKTIRNGSHIEMKIGKILLKTGTGEEVEGVVAELNTWIHII